MRPPDVVEKYMNEIFDTHERPGESYLAFRLPKEESEDGAAASSSSNAVTAAVTPVPDGEKKKGVGAVKRKVVVV